MALLLRRLSPLLSIALLVLLSGCLIQKDSSVKEPTATPSGPPLPPVGGRIAYISDRTGQRRGVRVIRSDGSGDTALLPDRIVAAVPVWASDGHRLVVPVDEAGKTQLVVVDVKADNSPGAATQLTHAAQDGNNVFPGWSPDGTNLVFQSDRSGSAQIYVLPAAGGAVRSFPGQPAYAGAPAWSPDGKTIAFVGGPDRDHTEVWTVPAAGGAPAVITNNGRAATRPIWTPDGAHLLFHLQTTFGGHTITEIQADGTGQRDLGAAPDAATPQAPGSGPPSQCSQQQENLFPEPSPDGKAIAFHSNRTCNNDVFVMDADGAGVTDLTNAPSGEVYPSWAPDGSRLVFASNRDGGGYRLYIIARDGTHLAPLTSGSGEYDDTFPTWSPLPQP